MTAWYDGNGARIVWNAYDPEGRVIRQTDANGAVSTLAYGEGTTTTTDANGNQTIYTFDDTCRTVKITNPDGTTRSMDYNSQNLLASETDELGHTTAHQYDKDGMRSARPALTALSVPGTMTRTTTSRKLSAMTGSSRNTPMTDTETWKPSP